ncbi:MAG: hemerythrin domain-containing protein [Alphaproteobacteria bacterium]|nr:hemerythrin domain-containing protein [Alphaproteobacteria bacterium]
MFESKDHALSILKEDHQKVKDLFDDFEDANSLREKKKIAATIIQELKVHATIEEEIFYPTVRKEAEEDIMNEADEEHHVAKLLIAELENMNGNEEHYEAKVRVLAESIRHHIREEENKMFPDIKNMDIDFEALGQELLDRKEELMENNIPVSWEEKMITSFWNKKEASSTKTKAKKIMPSLQKNGKKSSSKRNGSLRSAH